jgi:hypothetical protein
VILEGGVIAVIAIGAIVVVTKRKKPEVEAK